MAAMIDTTAPSRPLQSLQEVMGAPRLACGSAQPCEPHGERKEDGQCEVDEQRCWNGLVDAHKREGLASENGGADTRQDAEHPGWEKGSENVLRRRAATARQPDRHSTRSHS